MTDENQINAEQNKPERIELLRAQRLFYARAKLYQNSFAVCALLLPAIGILFGAKYPTIRPFLGFGSILILLLEVGIIAGAQKADCRRAAKVQEQFDTEVLGLHWNRMVVGGKVDIEDIREITSNPLPETELKRLINWYEPVVATLPLAVGRLVCQRTNITYDMRIRRKYAAVLLGSAIALIVVLTLAGLWQGLKINEIILTLYLPALPFAAFVLREHRKQGDTIDTLTTLKNEVEKLWERALSGAAHDELTTGSRALQDAIYRNRTSNPLVIDWLYNWLRARNEDLTRHTTEKLVTEAKQKLKVEELK